MNKNKIRSDLTGYKQKNTYDNKTITSNIYPTQLDKKPNFDISVHSKQNRIKDNDFNDLTNIVRNSVEKINNLFNQTEFLQTKNRLFQKTSKELRLESNNIDEYEELNKSNEIKKKERSSTLQKSSKANFTFNINNFINVPNISTTLPNISQEKNSIENDKINIRTAMNNKNRMYLNSINNKENLLIEHKGISNKRFSGLNDNHNYNNYSTLNDSLYQIDEIQTNNTNGNNNNTNKKLNTKNSNNINNPKNLKIPILNSKGSKANYNTNIKSDLSKSIKEVKESNTNTPAHNNDNINSIALSGLTTINQNRKVIYRMPNNKKKEHSNLNTAQKIKDFNKTINRVNKYKAKEKEKEKENNQSTINKQNLKKNVESLKNKTLKNKQKLSQSKKVFKTGDNFYQKKESDKEKNENDKNEVNTNDSINFDEITNNIKVAKQQRDEKNKIKINQNYKQNTINISVKTMDDLSCSKFKSNTMIGNISDRVSATNSPINTNNQKNKKRGSSIPYERKVSEKNEREASRQSSSRIFHQVVNIFYGKEFPNKINTNEILKLMLFFNEYLINNNLLNDYHENENKKLLNDYSKYISSKIKVDFPQEHDIVVDPSIKCVKKIQRAWRKTKIEKYLKKNKKTEVNELKHMIVNKYIKKSGYKVKKILGLFNTIVENFDNINRQPDINELFYQIQKLIHNKLTEYEKNLLYKEFINSIILHSNN